MKKRKLTLILVAFICTVVLTGCSGPKSVYNAAQTLMANGDYVAAAEKFESIGSYEDATSLAMYCKAVAMGESGNYSDAIAAFESFGDYKDSVYLKLYYEARSNEAAGNKVRAVQQFKAISLFRDSASRADGIIEGIYTESVNHAAEEDFESAWIAMNTLNQHELTYKDSETLEKYYSLRGREMLVSVTDYDQLIEIADDYDELKHADSVSRAEKIRKSVYEQAKASFNEKNYDDSINGFTALGNYSVSELMLKKSIRYKEITTASTAELLSSVMSNYIAISKQLLETCDIILVDPDEENTSSGITLEDIKQFEDGWKSAIDAYDVELEIFAIATPDEEHTDVWHKMHANIQAARELCTPFINLDPNEDGVYEGDEMNTIWNEYWPQFSNLLREGFEIIKPYAS